MFGDNPQRGPMKGDGSRLVVHSTFLTLQGEGPFAGVAAWFVRLGGCNLNCHWCDTEFELGSASVPVENLVADALTARDSAACVVVLTGGEPFRQPIGMLVTLLAASGLTVQVETNGTLFVPGPWAHERVHIVCSPKTPKIHPLLAPHVSAWKYVIEAGKVSPDDGLPLECPVGLGGRGNLPPFRPLPNIEAPIYVTPVDVPGQSSRYPSGQTLANMEEAASSALRWGYIMQPQTHKLIDWP